MTDREALAAALEYHDLTKNSLVAIAARERLAQLPEKCDNCDGEKVIVESELGESACPKCRGSGKVYPAELVERINEAIRPFHPALVARTDFDIAIAVLDALNGEPE